MWPTSTPTAAEVERNWFQRVFGLDVPPVYGTEDGYAL
jgi:hypothetical protein